MIRQKPTKRFSRGRCSVSIFFNEAHKEGETIKIPKAVFQKRFRDKDGTWRSTTSLNVSDIPKAILCLNAAFDFLTISPSPDDHSE